MPGFKDTLSETQIWQAIVLVKNADKISEIREKRTHGGCEYFHGNDNALEQPRAEKEMIETCQIRRKLSADEAGKLEQS